MTYSAGDAGRHARDTATLDRYTMLFCRAPEHRDAGRATWTAPWDESILFRVRLTDGHWKTSGGARGDFSDMQGLFRRHGIPVVNIV